MNTPIRDFISRYLRKDPLRLHMPGHKGSCLLGAEPWDTTEVEGADSLYEAEGIIREFYGLPAAAPEEKETKPEEQAPTVPDLFSFF